MMEINTYQEVNTYQEAVLEMRFFFSKISRITGRLTTVTVRHHDQADCNSKHHHSTLSFKGCAFQAKFPIVCQSDCRYLQS